MFNLKVVTALLAACAIGVGADNCEFPSRIGITPARAAKAKAAFRKAGLVPGKVGRAGTFNPTIEVIPDYNGKVVNFGKSITFALDHIRDGAWARTGVRQRSHTDKYRQEPTSPHQRPSKYQEFDLMQSLITTL